MDNPISRAEHEEFVRRMEDEHARLKGRIKTLEDTSEKNSEMLVAINKLATSMDVMQKEQTKQGERLQKLEAQDGEMWRKVTGYIVTAVIGIVIGFIFKQIGM